MTQWAFHPIQSMQESLLGYPARNLCKVYTKTESYHNIAILHVPSATQSQLVLSSIASYRTWGTYAASDDIIFPTWNLLVESGHEKL